MSGGASTAHTLRFGSAKAPIVINASDGKPTATVFFFHGLGDQGDGWAAGFRQQRVRYAKYILPNAPTRPVTLNFGMQMPAWYDILGLNANSGEDAASIESATAYVHSLVDAEVTAGVPAERIVLAGFSMGGALAIHAALTYERARLGCVVSLSGFLLGRHKFPGIYKTNLKTPIFMGHGTNDYLVPFNVGEMSAATLRTFNPNVQLRSYPIEHSSSPQELSDMDDFIRAQVPPI